MRQLSYPAVFGISNPQALQKRWNAYSWGWFVAYDLCQIIPISLEEILSFWIDLKELTEENIIVSYDDTDSFIETKWGVLAYKVSRMSTEEKKRLVLPAGVAKDICSPWNFALAMVRKIDNALTQPGLGWIEWNRPEKFAEQFLYLALEKCSKATRMDIQMEDEYGLRTISINLTALEVYLPKDEYEVSVLSRDPIDKVWTIGRRNICGKVQKVMVRDLPRTERM